MIDATYTPPNLGDLATAPSVYHKCGPRCSSSFYLTATRDNALDGSGSAVPGQVDDLIVQNYTSVPVRTDYKVTVESLLPASSGAKLVNVTSSDETVLLSPDSNGTATAVATGTATLVARAADGELSARRVDVTVSPSTSLTTWTGYAADSLAYHCNSQIDGLTAGKPLTSMDLWAYRNDSQSSYTWNRGCWAYGVANIGCMSPYNTYTGVGGGGALITPRHAVFCHHLGYYPRVGTKVRYVRSDNTTEEVTVEAVKAHPYTAGWIIAKQDIVICKYDRDISVPFAKVLPADPSGYFPSVATTDTAMYNAAIGTLLSIGSPYILACHTSQTKKLAVSAITVLPNTPTPRYEPGENPPAIEYSGVKHITGASDFRFSDIGGNPLGQTPSVGASGAPAFIVINNELVITNVWTTPTVGYGFYTDATIVNGMLDDLGGGYNLTEVDLSEFPTY